MNARIIDEDDLAFFSGFNPKDAGPGGLGFVGDDGYLFAQDGVEERRFTYIGAPDEGDIAGFSFFSHSIYRTDRGSVPTF